VRAGGYALKIGRGAGAPMKCYVGSFGVGGLSRVLSWTRRPRYAMVQTGYIGNTLLRIHR